MESPQFEVVNFTRDQKIIFRDRVGETTFEGHSNDTVGSIMHQFIFLLLIIIFTQYTLRRCFGIISKLN